MSRTWPSLAGLVLVLASATATAAPWDIDMADAPSVKSYERLMLPPPEGTVAQPHLLTPRSPSMNFTRFTPASALLESPLTDDAEAQALGAEMFGIYCQLCHGTGMTPGPVGEPGRLPGVIPFGLLKSIIASRSDGDLYLTIRNGGAVMPSYGWAMNDEEMWSIVHYVRSETTGGQ
ncbi:MAG: c-type cytochrome [Deltaproteobacteria bacterium]|nr:c-type cytochrome [Deltaproteobacteria bacterium]